MALVASLVPPSQVGFALGLVQMAVYSGASLGPLFGGVVADVLGYRWTFGATGIMLLLGGILIVALVREDFAAPEDTPERSGLMASAAAIARALPALGAVIALGGIFMANHTSRPLLPLLVETVGADTSLINTAAGSVYGAWAAASAVSALIAGRLSDRIQHRAIALSGGVGSVVCLIGQAYVPSVSGLIITSLAAGFFSGGLLTTANAVLARFAPKEQYGTVYGISSSVNAVGRAGGPILGAALAASINLRAAFLGTAAVFALVTVCLALTVPPRLHDPGE
jgi:DHA1 family multidrug resistance protein-like MFS transporter